MTLETVFTCRYCGDSGETMPDLDPAPDVCPMCLLQRVGPLIRQAGRKVAEGELRSNVAWWLEQQLLEVGFTDVWARRFADGDQEWVDRQFHEYILRRGVDAP